MRRAHLPTELLYRFESQSASVYASITLTVTFTNKKGSAHRSTERGFKRISLRLSSEYCKADTRTTTQAAPESSSFVAVSPSMALGMYSVVLKLGLTSVGNLMNEGLGAPPASRTLLANSHNASRSLDNDVAATKRTFWTSSKGQKNTPSRWITHTMASPASKTSTLDYVNQSLPALPRILWIIGCTCMGVGSYSRYSCAFVTQNNA
ncbi:hypothetical protein BDW22DRAFT_849684 [Trametopsis cervina]|nr:hypothetical protein BDW22DRAFT_849684 [Trametopsis cervina]